MLGLMVVTALLAQGGEPIGRGVSEALARARAATIRDLHYDLFFSLPASRDDPVHGRALLRFRLAAAQPIVLDFAPGAAHVKTVRVGGQAAPYDVRDGHIVLPAAPFGAGENTVEIDFVAGDGPLNRTDEFMYTLFVPARAHLAFPCFDQPNLKARYSLTLDVPADWQAVGNGALVSSDEREGRALLRFAETPPLPTYLFSFAAGKFSIETAVRGGRELRMFHRETDAARLARNRDALFDLHASALQWLEAYTGIPYPWGKLDFLMLPAFQFSGMEHAGAILYNASLILDESATQQQLLDRATTIAHETAHMWFGDLVTMDWFSDVWMKEVFANFMAAKIVNPSFPDLDHDLRFLLSHYPAAYQVDRTAGTNPIRQPLANLDEAGQLYGPIIYQKAPIVMRQLERMIGEDALRDGLREYLRTYQFGNASWLDLVAILDARTPADLGSWSRAWVTARGRPTFTMGVRLSGQRILSLDLSIGDPLRRDLVWPQKLIVALGYEGRIERIDVAVNGAHAVVSEAAGRDRPLYVLPNGDGLGYGLFVLDARSRRYLIAHIDDVPDALTRGSAWVTLWDNMVEGYLSPDAFTAAALRALPLEPDEQNRQRILAYVNRAFWRWLPHRTRLALAPRLETVLRSGLAAARTRSAKAAWFNTYRDVVLTARGIAWLERVWRRDERIEGLTFAESDEIVMALELAVRGVANADEILRQQLGRTRDPDRRARLAFVAPAAAADPAVREQSFERFRAVENRRREPWVVEALGYLNHPLREAFARKFVRPSLELLPEIQRTGDIFFPTRWSEAALSGHRSAEAAEAVRDFLARELQLPQRLRWVLLIAADDLLRRAPAAPAR